VRSPSTEDPGIFPFEVLQDQPLTCTQLSCEVPNILFSMESGDDGHAKLVAVFPIFKSSIDL